jgi:type VI secretion system protein ImpK
MTRSIGKIERSSVSRPSAICSLLRDTALLVTTLNAGGTVEKLNAFRMRCDQLVEKFGDGLEEQGYANDILEDARTAQCALLDEIALRYLNPDDKFTWASFPLQVHHFGKHDAGERVFDRLRVRMRETSPHDDLLNCYAMILALGFQGRYAIEGETKRRALIVELNDLLTQLHPAPPMPFMRTNNPNHSGNWSWCFGPWAIAATAILVALVTWLVWRFSLDSQFGAMLPWIARP